jgi:hypothetical protein
MTGTKNANGKNIVGAVYDRPFFLESTKDGRLQTAPTMLRLKSGREAGQACNQEKLDQLFVRDVSERVRKGHRGNPS